MKVKDPDSSAGGDEGDSMSFDEFVKKYYPLLRRSADRRLDSYGRRDSHLAEDLVQEAFLRIWRRDLHLLESGDGEVELTRQLAYTVLGNLVTDYFRRAASREQPTDEIGDSAATSTAPDPATFVTEDDATTRAFIESLGPRQQEILLHLDGGDTPKEIGVKLGLAEGTVRNYITRIKEAAKGAFPDALRHRFPEI